MQYADLGKPICPLLTFPLPFAPWPRPLRYPTPFSLHPQSIGIKNQSRLSTANAVSRVDNLSFLEDVVPKTTTVREYRQRKARAPAANPALSNGQTVLDASARTLVQRTLGGNGAQEGQQGGAAIPPEVMDTLDNDGQGHGHGQAGLTNGGQTGLVFQQYHPAGPEQRDQAGDVEMG